MKVVFGGVVFIYHVVVDDSQQRGAAEYRRRARIAGRGQDGGAVWCFGDIDGRPGTVNTLISLGDGFEIDGGCELCDVCNGTPSGFCFLDDVCWCTVREYGLVHGPPFIVGIASCR
jgi:hypothetical protein